jgi:hypothetical protein
MSKVKSKFVFICAAGHSGSTLLDLLLGAHPAGISVGEITQLPKNISLDSVCSCGEHLSKCEFWNQMITDFGKSIDIDLWKEPYRLDLGFIKAGHEIDPRHQTRFRMMLRKLTYGAEYTHLRWRTPAPPFLHRAWKQGTENKRLLFQFILDQTNRKFVVDSSKHYLGGLNLYQAAPDETRIILLLRDGRAVFNSGISRGMSPKSALNAWIRQCRRSSLILTKHLPDSALLTVHYEALATSPESELRRICEFLGIDFSRQMLEFGRTDSHIANGNRMRFVQSSEIKLDERWRGELSAPMLQFFERRAGKLNRQLGYRD